MAVAIEDMCDRRITQLQNSEAGAVQRGRYLRLFKRLLVQGAPKFEKVIDPPTASIFFLALLSYEVAPKFSKVRGRVVQNMKGIKEFKSSA